MIWATVSSWSCFCWLYRAYPSLAAKNIISLILVLTIWWCPCIESSLVLLEGGSRPAHRKNLGGPQSKLEVIVAEAPWLRESCETRSCRTFWPWFGVWILLQSAVECCWKAFSRWVRSQLCFEWNLMHFLTWGLVSYFSSFWLTYKIPP